MTGDRCLPPGRTLVNVSLNDAALELKHSYPSLSLLSDPGHGIDVAYGFFAQRDFFPDCSFDNNDWVVYYIGRKSQTEEEVQRFNYDPNPAIYTGLMIIFEGLAADVWDHRLGC